MKFVVYKDKAGEFRWYLKANNGEKIANGGEGYVAKRDCLHGIDLVKGCADAEVIDETVDPAAPGA